MISYGQHLENAKKYAKTADHLLSSTFPLVRDPRMLLSVLQNVFMAYKSVVMYMLCKDVASRKIPPFDEDFQSMFDLFKARSERRYNINPEYIRIIDEIYSLIREHKNSPVEFARHEVFVICQSNYDMKTLSTQNLRDYITKAKLFIDEISTRH